MRQAILITLSAVLLAACGFQLRGEARLPGFMDRTFLTVADDSTGFVRELGLLLEANGVAVVDEPGPDAATMRIHSQSIWRQALSVTGQARVREFLIVFEVSWQLEDAAGEIALERSTIRLTREYSFDEGEILAAQREEEFLREDLGRAMAAQLIRRLEAFSAQSPPEGTGGS